MAPTKQEILAASAGWVAVTLNVLPGLGAGYLYQRRWKAYWITSALATAWFALGAVQDKTRRLQWSKKTSSSAWVDWPPFQQERQSKLDWQ